MSNRFQPGDLVRIRRDLGVSFVATTFGVVDNFELGMILGNRDNFMHLYNVLTSDGKIKVVPNISLEFL
jgi:hypothetical protein